jgi:2-polyprenyl-3-methyl-5-hydroxy-6-metoxy-1,4-benzoquinol methylase
MRYAESAGRITSHLVLRSWASSYSNLLDVGCASGYLLGHLCALGRTVVGVEPNSGAAVVARGRGYKVCEVSVEEAIVRLYAEGYRFDCIVFGDVLEHLVDPWTVLHDACRLLDPAGVVLISLPNIVSVRARISILMGRWRYHEVGVFDRTHLRFFDLASGRELVTRAGLEIVEEDFVGPLTYAAGRWGQSLTRRVPSLFANQMLFRAAPVNRF